MSAASVGLFAWLAASAPGANAGPTLDPLPTEERDETRAREAWNRGAQAYAEGRLADAIREFEETFRYSGRPGPLFSLGQAHRHRWEKDGDPRQRQLAILRYEQYLQLDPNGRRRLEAERWVHELQTIDELEDDADAPRIFTRVGVSSTTEGAIATIDGGPPLELPVTPDVAPGRHEIVVSAPGHRSQRRAIDVPEGSTVPLEVTLVPLAGMLRVHAPAGAELYVDGQRVARLPTRDPVAVRPGVHQVGVAQRGRSLFIREVELGRGERKDLVAELERTGQRKVAWAAIGVGAGASAASIVLMALAFDAQHEAKQIEQVRQDGSIDDALVRERDDLIARRDGLRTAAIATGITGLAVLATGIILHLTDRPPVASQLRPPTSPRPTKRIAARPSFTITVGRDGTLLRGTF